MNHLIQPGTFSAKFAQRILELNPLDRMPKYLVELENCFHDKKVFVARHDELVLKLSDTWQIKTLSTSPQGAAVTDLTSQRQFTNNLKRFLSTPPQDHNPHVLGTRRNSPNTVQNFIVQRWHDHDMPLNKRLQRLIDKGLITRVEICLAYYLGLHKPTTELMKDPIFESSDLTYDGDHYFFGDDPAKHSDPHSPKIDALDKQFAESLQKTLDFYVLVLEFDLM